MVDGDGNVIGSLASVTYVKDNFISKDEDLDQMIEDAVNDSLYEEEVDEDGNVVYILKNDIVQQIIERTNI